MKSSFAKIRLVGAQPVLRLDSASPLLNSKAGNQEGRTQKGNAAPLYETSPWTQDIFHLARPLNGTNVDLSSVAKQGMALSRLLLLYMLASEVRYAETKPIDFVCSRSSRRAMNIVTEMQTALNNCNSSTILPTPVQLPCTELHVASWERKSYHERRQDISASLRHLFEGVKVARPLGQAECGSVLLQRLEHNINSYLLILTHLQSQWRTQNCPVFLEAPSV
ncbi:thrombopoietin isoform X2 [Phyllopteryx taeniolatus]|uniref:thrombopoietin isoform X2 n=1 Tax=Phyllopteryx taeniolatus TaxID=161469 RepID=UPI002AD313F0|nr:thrombopoietin isoform X2 [Phyllopteryx taeniolatus]